LATPTIDAVSWALAAAGMTRKDSRTRNAFRHLSIVSLRTLTTGRFDVQRG
jgi:hypothetical protein